MMKPEDGILHVFDDAAAMARGAAEWLTEQMRARPGIEKSIALAGGSTPKPVYQALAAAPLATRFPWDDVNFFIGDERFVPTTNPASNYGMILDAMLQSVPVPSRNVHPVPTEGITIEQAADAYGKMLAAVYGADTLRPDKPLFDAVLLGLGDDGHTASLLPGEPALTVQDRWVVPVTHGRSEARITLTYPALNSSAQVAFLVAGAGKTEILDRVLSGGADVPAARLRPVGTVHWFVDRAAAGARA
jgi:6-phosphogluconolactonase